MKEFRDAEHLFKHNEKIAIGEVVWCYGYRYTKVEPNRYENDASSIVKLCGCAPFRQFNQGVRKRTVRNQFGQALR